MWTWPISPSRATGWSPRPWWKMWLHWLSKGNDAVRYAHRIYGSIPFCKVKHARFGEAKGKVAVICLRSLFELSDAHGLDGRFSHLALTSYRPRRPLRWSRFEGCRSDLSCHRLCFTCPQPLSKSSELVLLLPPLHPAKCSIRIRTTSPVTDSRASMRAMAWFMWPSHIRWLSMIRGTWVSPSRGSFCWMATILMPSSPRMPAMRAMTPGWSRAITRR